jgi:hypothetical protein
MVGRVIEHGLCIVADAIPGARRKAAANDPVANALRSLISFTSMSFVSVLTPLDVAERRPMILAKGYIGDGQGGSGM